MKLPPFPLPVLATVISITDIQCQRQGQRYFYYSIKTLLPDVPIALCPGRFGGIIGACWSLTYWGYKTAISCLITLLYTLLTPHGLRSQR